MKRVHLLRHAKSSWEDALLDDRGRPLAPRGRKAARRLAAWIAAHDIEPDLVLCSPARRAEETLDAVLAAFGAPQVIVDERLYHASASDLLELLRALAEPVREAVFVGHNPGLADLCLALAVPGTLRDRVAAKLPTGALATLDAEIGTWRELGPGGAQLVQLVLPRELA